MLNLSTLAPLVTKRSAILTKLKSLRGMAAVGIATVVVYAAAGYLGGFLDADAAVSTVVNALLALVQ